MRGIERPRVFNRAAKGSDPTILKVDDEMPLLLHVRAVAGYKYADTIYMHPCWKYFAYREEMIPWFKAQLGTFGIVEVTPLDIAHLWDLGLDQTPDDPDFIELELDAAPFESLDGLLVLSELSRQAHREAGRAQAAHIDHTLWIVVRTLQAEFLLGPHEAESLELLVHDALTGPRWPAKPTSEELSAAMGELSREGHRVIAGQPVQQSGEVDPRHAQIRARLRRGDRARYGRILYRQGNATWRWLIEHREQIRGHTEFALPEAIGVETEGPRGKPLQMPWAIAQRRTRPDYGEEGWRVFGDQTPYDLIPVEIVPAHDECSTEASSSCSREHASPS